VAADNLLSPIRGDSNYLTNIQNITSIAQGLGIICLWQIQALMNLDTSYSYPSYAYSGNPFAPTGGDATVIPDTATFLRALSTLANTIREYPNACIEVYNEPTSHYPANLTNYDKYFANLPSAISTIRATGFDSLIFIMGGMAFIPTHAGSPEATMQWALDHKSLFDGNVAADVHTYYHLVGAQNIPLDYDTLKSLWLNQGRIAEALAAGIPIFFGETGVFQIVNGQPATNISDQTTATLNLVRFCIENNLGYGFHSPDDFSECQMMSSMTPPQFNQVGLTLSEFNR
jgi:hypothetical protein